jgi:CheY-like chemotaxis protein
MSKAEITPQKHNLVPRGRRNFTVKILVIKKRNLEGKTQKKGRTMNRKKQDPLSGKKKEMEQNLQSVYRNKTEIERLTTLTIKELSKIHQMRLDTESLQGKPKLSNQEGLSETKTGPSDNRHNGFGLEYELTNMKMIRKILSLSTPFQEKPCEKKSGKDTKKGSPPRKGKVKSKGKDKKTDATTKILIVEDDRTTVKIIGHLLEQHHYRVLSAMDAEEGLKMIFKEVPDLVLLDIMLPGMDGFQVLNKLKGNQQTSRIPVIILSSLSGERDVLKGLERGASDYILKPFSPQILFFKIKKLLAFQNEHIAYYRNL